MTTLDEKGRCCGRKPIPYSGKLQGRAPYKFCPRCDRELDTTTAKQIENWAWRRNADGSFSAKSKRG